MAAVTYQCPNCGGGLAFDPQSQRFKCEYCLSDFSQEDLERLSDGGEAESGEAESEKPESEKPESERPESGTPEQEGASVYSCPNCGAEIVTDDTTAATYCYYCHNPVVLSGRLRGEYRPDYVIPFAIDRKKAEEIFEGWIRGKRYVPRDFYSKEQLEKLSGVYFPYWLYSCKVEGRLEGQGARLNSWAAGGTRFTETQRFQVEREGSMEVEHVPRNALKKANGRLAEGVLPFNMEELKPFSMTYLSGFMAENRDIGNQEYAREVEEEIHSYAVESLKGSVSGYDQLSLSRQDADIVDPAWRLALLPVWALTYRHARDGKIYYFALNGQTGKICGELPVSREKLTALFLKVFLPVAAALLIVGYFL